MQVLIAGAAVAGLLPRGKSVAEWATAALSTRDPETIQSNEWKGAAWVKCVKDHLSARPALIQALTSALGCAQGSGAVNTLDGVRLHQLVANVMRINIFLPSERPSWAMEAYKPLVQCERLLQEQMECLRARISEVRSFVPHGTSFKETVVAVEGAANIGAPTGLVQTDLPIVKAANARALTYDWSSFEAVEKELDRIDQGVGLQAMAGIGRVETEEAAQILEYLRSSRAWIQVGRQLAASQESESESTVEEELKALVGKWRGLLKQPGGGQ
jgi:hypothetical protein